MKKASATFVILTSFILNTMAQPNGGFENWITEFSFENPEGWQTGNFLSLTSPPNPLSVFKTIGIDKHSGNYAMKIQTVAINNNPSPTLIADSAGAVFIGKINYSPFSYKNGYPYTGRPEKLGFWAKYIPVGNDSGSAGILLQKWNGISHDTIATGQIKIPYSPGFTFFQTSLDYYTSDLPDSATIIFSSSNVNSSRVGSTIYIDDVAFTGWVGTDEHDKNVGNVKIFPNPAEDHLTITTEIKEAENVKIIDVAGKQVGWFKIQNYNASVNTSSFAQGIYFYEILDKKEKVLTNGKFNVVK